MSIQGQVTRLENAKAAIKAKLENLEVTVPSEDTLEDYPNLMSHLSGSLPLLYKFNWNVGYQSEGTWTWEDPTNCFSDIYIVEKDHYYKFYFAYPRGTRSRIMFTTTDITQITSASSVVGEKIYHNDNASANNLTRFIPDGNTAASASSYWKASDDGYVIMTKTNTKQSNMRTMCIDYTDLYNSQQS